MSVQDRISKDINEAMYGKTYEVLVEGLSKNKEDMYTGRTRGNKLVNFTASEDVTGKIVKVKITQPKTWTLEE